MSRYDAEYISHYTGIPNVKIVSSLSGFYTRSNRAYRPSTRKVLIFSKTGMRAVFGKLEEEAKRLSNRR